MQLSVIPPPIQIEGPPTRFKYAVRLDHVSVYGQQSFEEVARVLDHIHVEPQDPCFIVECVEEQMIPALCQNGPSLHLDRRLPPRHSSRDSVAEVLLPQPRSPELGVQCWHAMAQVREGGV